MSVLADREPGADDAAGGGTPGRAVLAGVGLTVAALLVSIVGGVAFVIPVVVLGLDVASVPVFLGLTAAGQLGFLVVAYAYARYADLRVRLAVPDRRDLGLAVGGTLAALLVAMALSVVLALLGLLPGSVLSEAATGTPTLLLGLAFLSIVLVAPAEEFLFRGVIQTRLRRAFGPAGAIAIASLLFGSLHLANFTGTVAPVVAGALLITVVGAVFGVLYERAGNLVVPILAHGAYNTVLFGIAFASV